MCGCEGDDLLDYWKYYADEQTRQEDAALYTDMQMPPKEPCPYDRDRFLPRSLDEKLRERGELDEWDGPDPDEHTVK